MKLNFVVLIGILAVSACATNPPTEDVKIGMSKDQVFNAAGNPNKKRPGSGGGETWVYNNGGYLCTVQFTNQIASGKSPCEKRANASAFDDIGNGVHNTFTGLGIVQCSGSKPERQPSCELRCRDDKWVQICEQPIKAQ